MKPKKQAFRHDPKRRIYGDCHRAALASIFELELDDVPHFADGWPTGAEFTRRVEAWLSHRNLGSANVPYNGDLREVLSSVKAGCPATHYLLGGMSRTGVGHTVICKDDMIVHDPSRDNVGIVGPMEDGFYWVTFFVPKRPELCTPFSPMPRRRGRWAWLADLCRFRREAVDAATASPI